MSHDPLCPCSYKDTQVSPKWEERCVCDLLTAARAQEREKVIAQITTIDAEDITTMVDIGYGPTSRGLYVHCYECSGEGFGADAALNFVIETLRGES